MGILIEYYSSGAVAEHGSSSLWKNITIARTAKYVDEPKPADIKYISNTTTSESSSKNPSLVTVSYFSKIVSNDTDSTVIDLSKTEDDDPSSQQMQGESIAANSRKTKQSKAKKSSSENIKEQQRKSFRDIKEPTDLYLKALDKELDRKQQQTSTTTSSRRTSNPKKNNKTQKPYEADITAYDDIDNYHLSFNSSAGKTMHRSTVRDHLVPSSSSSNYIVGNNTNHGEPKSEREETMINVVCSNNK